MGAQSTNPHLTAKIVGSYLRHHTVGASELPNLITCAPRLLWIRFGRPGCALNRPTWSPIKGSSARVSTIRSAIVVRQRFFWIRATDISAQHFWTSGLERLGPVRQREPAHSGGEGAFHGVVVHGQASCRADIASMWKFW